MIKVREDITGWVMSENGVQDSRLIVIKQIDDYVSPQGKHHARYLCKCNCGSEKDIIANLSDIKHGDVKSCGCLKKESHYNTYKKYNRYDLSGEYGVGWTSNTNKEFYFDLEDYDKIKDYCWSELINEKDNYHELKAWDILSHKSIHMHQLILDVNCDHKDRNTFNNRKNNLRKATTTENNRNRGVFKNNTSGIIGVNFEKQSKMWRSRINVNNNRIQLGLFIDKKDAIIARLKAEAKYYGEFAPQRHLFKEYGIEDNMI